MAKKQLTPEIEQMDIEQELSQREKLGYKKSTDGIDCSKDPILVEESHAEENDINLIVQKYTPREIIDSAATVQAAYGDFSGIDDYHTMLNKVASAGEAFMTLPAKVRTKFNNDPGELLQAIQKSETNDEIQKELQKLGILNEKVSVGTITSSGQGAGAPTPPVPGEK